MKKSTILKIANESYYLALTSVQNTECHANHDIITITGFMDKDQKMDHLISNLESAVQAGDIDNS